MWAEMTSLGAELGARQELPVEAEAVARDTMRRVRRNVKHLERTLRELATGFARTSQVSGRTRL